jgi:hypothetical protein
MSRQSNSPVIRRSLTSVAIAAIAAVVLSACSATAEAPSGAPEGAAVQVVDEAMLSDLGLAGLDARAIVDQLDAQPLAERPDYSASVRPDALVITDASQRETTPPMPKDEFYVSIAPYETQTHECYFHSLTGCVGEIHNGEVVVLITDASSGEVLIDESRTTFDNGFVGVWLPRDIDVQVTIGYNGKTATTELSTRSDEDATCVTTMQLA